VGLSNGFRATGKADSDGGYGQAGQRIHRLADAGLDAFAIGSSGMVIGNGGHEPSS